MMSLMKKANSKTENVLSGYALGRLARRPPPATPAAAATPAPELPATTGVDSAGTIAAPAMPATAGEPAPELPASGVGPAPPPPAQPAAGTRRARPRGPNEPRIIGTFGLATLSETYERGTHVGFRITCHRHKNSDDCIECEKTITMGQPGEGQLSEKECVLRLKRWYLMGAEPTVVAEFPKGEQRTGLQFLFPPTSPTCKCVRVFAKNYKIRLLHIHLHDYVRAWAIRIARKGI